jgi:hypothetical protein
MSLPETPPENVSDTVPRARVFQQGNKKRLIIGNGHELILLKTSNQYPSNPIREQGSDKANQMEFNKRLEPDQSPENVSDTVSLGTKKHPG